MEEHLIAFLHDAGFKTHEIAQQTGEEINAIDSVIDDYRLFLADVEEDYYENHWPKMREAVAEMYKDVPERQRKEMRRVFLLDEIRSLRKQPESETRDAKLKSLIFEAQLLLEERKGFSEQEIQRAREVPMSRLIKHRNFIAKCPFHKDDSPSLNVKGDFYFCHGCGARGDSISFVMKTENLSFAEAVKRLLKV